MGNRIKGITVEIGGDTTGLDKALRGVNSSITKTQSALNDVNKLLKLDPSNTVLVAQSSSYFRKRLVRQVTNWKHWNLHRSRLRQLFKGGI